MSAPRVHRVTVTPVVVRTVALPIGTRMVRNPVEPCSYCDTSARRRARPALFGTVVCHVAGVGSRGGFSVCWDSGIWEAGLDVASVTAVSQQATVTGLPRSMRTSRAAG
ncbi:MAG: hypothetical protein ACRDTA_30735 [Pseudonocardiaceae bacterium]